MLRGRLIEAYDSRDPTLQASLPRAVDLCDLDRRHHDANHYLDAAAAGHSQTVYAALHELRSACSIGADK